MVAVSEILCVFYKSSYFSVGDCSLIHAICEFLYDWAIQFKDGDYFFVQFDALIVFSVKPLLFALPFEIVEEAFYVFVFFAFVDAWL